MMLCLRFPESGVPSILIKEGRQRLPLFTWDILEFTPGSHHLLLVLPLSPSPGGACGVETGEYDDLKEARIWEA